MELREIATLIFCNHIWLHTPPLQHHHYTAPQAYEHRLPMQAAAHIELEGSIVFASHYRKLEAMQGWPDSPFQGWEPVKVIRSCGASPAST